MNTDKEKAKEIEITSQVPSTIEPHGLSRPRSIVAVLRMISVCLSVFIRVNPWFQRIYPTDAS
jgi:hypothetical protein